MNTRLRLTALAAVFAFLTTTTSALHARVLAPEGIEVPDGTRKCIKPNDRVPVPTDLFVPLACTAPVVNVSATAGNQDESFVVVNPTNTNNLVAFANTTSNSIFRAFSMDGGATWTRGTVATGVACCDAQAAFDTFGNLFLVYINASVNQINVILSTDGGVTFSAPLTVGTGSVDQPSIAVGNGSVWVDWNSSGSMVARGAPVTGLGVWGPFNAQQTIPSASGSFGGIAVGPGPNGGKVIVTYQNPTGGQGPATIYANVDADGLGAGGFGARVTVTTTNVGGFDFIPAQSGRSIDAEAGVVWDATGGPFNNRIYLVYTEETVNENNDTDIMVRTSTNDGATWSAPVRVNDDLTTRSQFLPYIALDRLSGTVAVGFHDARNDTGVPGSGGTNTTPNDDAEYYGTFSTNGGVTWAANTRLSGGFSNAAAAANGVDYGDYVGQAAHAGKLYTVWADNSNCDGTNANGTLSAFDLYMNILMIPSGTPSPTPTATATVTPTATATATSTATATLPLPLPLLRQLHLLQRQQQPPTATPTATATVAPTVSISGTVIYCSNPALNPVPGVTMTLTGDMSGSTLTDGSGNYTFSSLPSGGNYTVTPTKTALAPGSAGINGVDVLAVQKHFLGIALLPVGCRRTAADVNGVFPPGAMARSMEVTSLPFRNSSSAIQAGSSMLENAQFTPANRTYTGIVTDQTAQNYDALVFGDVATGFIHRPEGPSQTAAGDDGMSVSALSGLNTSADEVAATVAAVALPEVAVAQAQSNFIAAVRTSAIDAKNKLVGFQGDFTFDERVVTFQSEPVQKAGITGGNWNVSGNVLPGAGPIRTLRIIGLLERWLHAALRVGNAVRTEDDPGEPGSSKHAIALGGATGPVHLHRRRSQDAEAWQRSAWQRHHIDLFWRAGSLTPPGFGVFCILTYRNALAGSATPPSSSFASRRRQRLQTPTAAATATPTAAPALTLTPTPPD